MKIYIPSRGRAHITRTLSSLPPALQKNATYVVPKHQLTDYLAAGFNAVSPPPSIDRIAVTRQWIIEHHLRNYGDVTDKVCMLDDDLVFYMHDAATGKFRSAKHDPKVVLAGFQQLSKLLDTHAHGGILIQLGSNRLESPGTPIYNSRVCRAIAFRASVLKQHWPSTKFGSVPVQDDFHATLTLLELGYPNAIVTSITQEQTGGSGSAGGASDYRDMAYHAESVHKLKALHPEFVWVVDKKTKTAWKGEARIDVVVAWKKAIAAGIAKYGERKLRRSP